MTFENQQFLYENQDNPDYAEVEECLKETMIEEYEKDIRSDIDRTVGAFMDYMEHANREGIPEDVSNALWALVESGLAFKFADRHKPINIVVNAATRWKAEELYDKNN